MPPKRISKSFEKAIESAKTAAEFDKLAKEFIEENPGFIDKIKCKVMQQVPPRNPLGLRGSWTPAEMMDQAERRNQQREEARRQTERQLELEQIERRWQKTMEQAATPTNSPTPTPTPTPTTGGATIIARPRQQPAQPSTLEVTEPPGKRLISFDDD